MLAYKRSIDRRRYLNTRHFYTILNVDDAETKLPDDRVWLDHDIDLVLSRDELQNAMEQLTDAQRETLRLYFYEGYTLAEIADKLGQTQGNIRNHYYRGLEKLKCRLQRSRGRAIVTTIPSRVS